MLIFRGNVASRIVSNKRGPPFSAELPPLSGKEILDLRTSVQKCTKYTQDKPKYVQQHTTMELCL